MHARTYLYNENNRVRVNATIVYAYEHYKMIIGGYARRPVAKTIKKNTNSTQNKSQIHRAK